MHEYHDDKIDVVVDFVQNRAQPRTFRWGQHTYTIDKVNLVHATREGQRRVFFFAVSDEEQSYKLRFDPEHLEWKLTELYRPNT